jgi:FkbM family methyltransferase
VSLTGAIERLVRQRVIELRRPDRLTFNGVKLDLSGPRVSDGVRNMVYQGRYEMHEREVLNRTLRPDDVLLELGSGMGYLTTLAAGIAREVRSFDANPVMVEVARQTVARNGRQAAIRNAVLVRSPESETMPFHVEPDFTGSSMIPSATGRKIDVPIIDFASACEGATYLMVDIEGFEVELLRGEIPAVRSICVECHPWLTDAKQISAMLTSLFEQGFALDVEKSDDIVLYLERT